MTTAQEIGQCALCTLALKNVFKQGETSLSPLPMTRMFLVVGPLERLLRMSFYTLEDTALGRAESMQ